MLSDLNAKALEELHNVVKHVVLLNSDKKNDCSISYLENEISIWIRCHWRNYHSTVVRDGWVYSNSWHIETRRAKDVKSCYGKLKKINEELDKLLNPDNWKKLVLETALESKEDLKYAPYTAVTILDLDKIKEELLNEHELNLDYKAIEDLTLDKTLALIPNEQNDSFYWGIQQPDEISSAVVYNYTVKEKSKYSSITTSYTSRYPTVKDWLND